MPFFTLVQSEFESSINRMCTFLGKMQLTV